MPPPDASTLAELRRALSTLGAPEQGFSSQEHRLSFGSRVLDDALDGGLPAGTLHEVYAGAGNDGPAAFGFSLAMLLRAAPGRTMVFIRQDMAARELGELYPPGLAEFGADPRSILSVQVKDAVEALRAGNEALRCQALGGVAIELWGKTKTVDLTATRRLARAAEKAGVTALLIRHAAQPEPSAAMSRWRVCSAPGAPFIADAPGTSRFDIELLRHRAGLPARRFCVEWDRDQFAFRTAAFQTSALPRFVAAAPADRPAAPHQAPLRRAG